MERFKKNLCNIKLYTNELLKLGDKITDVENKKEILYYLNVIKKNIDIIIYQEMSNFTIEKQELINYLYYLEDKTDPVFQKEVRNSISKFVQYIKSDNK